LHSFPTRRSSDLVENTKRIQLDLFENMKVDSIVLWDKRKMFSLNKDSSSGESLKYKRKYDAVFIDFEEELKKGEDYIIRFYYSGKPFEAINAPWVDGFVWKIDSNGKHVVGVAVQGTEASL